MKQFTIPSVFTAIDRVTAPVRKMQASVNKFVKDVQDNMDRVRQKNEHLENASRQLVLTGLIILAPLVLAAKQAIEFEDRMADVAKTTQLVGKELKQVEDGLLTMSPATRTSIEDLQKLAAIGGQAGIKGSKEILAYVDAVDKFNVALGSDFQGGVEEASKAISGLHLLFKETRDMSAPDAITKTGSAINALSAKGVSVPEMTEFASRVGALPDAIKPSVQATAALGATFNKLNISAEISSRALGDVLSTAARNVNGFATQMGISREEASKLLNTDPTEFVARFSKTLNGLNAEQLTKVLDELELKDSGSIKILGSLGSSIELLAEFQSIANEEFAKGTSLLEEFNVKNNTTAARLARAKNSVEALSIMLGEQLLPVINRALEKMMPVFQMILKWVKAHPILTKVILFSVGALGLLTLALAGATYAMWLFNIAAAANPIGLIILGVAALIGLITTLVVYWDEWGEKLTLLFLPLRPLGMLIDLLFTLKTAWDNISSAFENGGILQVIESIGKAIISLVLFPLRQIMKMVGAVGSLVGIQAPQNWSKDFEKWLSTVDTNGASTTWEENNTRKPVDTRSSRDESISKMLSEKNTNSKVTFEVVDPFGILKQRDGNDNPFAQIRPVVGSTVGGF